MSIQKDESPEIKELIARRDKFLADNPNMKAVQAEIDRLMGTTLDPNVRLEILFICIAEKLQEMKNVFGEIADIAEKSLKKS